MTPDELRDKFISYYQQKAHTVIPSAGLVPENDPTTLFTGSGMQPLIPYLLGEKHPGGTRLVNSQKCFRSQDIEEVGDDRHTTFFEMLGNWSLGDYFKNEQLEWFFTFLVEEISVDPKKLYVSVFRGNDELGVEKDTESVEIWKELFSRYQIDAKVIDFAEVEGMKDGRIFYYPESKNWWSRSGVPADMPAGEPGGPDSEVFYDFGPELGLHENSKFADQVCHVNCDCGRFLEIGNSVFMQYIKNPDGTFSELSQKNVDFGGGLERILAVSSESPSPDVFTTELFSPICKSLESRAIGKYGESKQINRSYQVIADHLKAAVMLAAAGVLPGNKAQEYFSRRLVRRAIRFAKMIGIKEAFVADIVPIVADIYKKPYPEILAQSEKIALELAKEESKFERTLDKGLREIEKYPKLTGEIAFKLYESYGFPFELTQEIAEEKGQSISHDDFQKAKSAHAEASRSASAGVFKGGLQDASEKTTQYHTATHLLHAALRQVLGKEAEQRGSHITSERLRFDFTFPTALSEDQISAVENLVNQWISEDLPMHKTQQSKQEALSDGALAFFREKYPDVVSVYTVGRDPKNDWVSKELCGGPHVERTGLIGKIEIFKEKSASAGVRRIYAR